MNEKQSLRKKAIHICIIIIILVSIVFVALMSMLRYNENGEINMPFVISKITVISTVDGKDVENSQYKWEKIINQNNDIYIYVEKNINYKKTETISSIKLENFKILQLPEKGEISFYKQSENNGALYENTENNAFQTLEYKGAQVSNAKKLEVSNQGGIIEFRCSNNNVGLYQSNDDEQIDYKDLLKKIKIDEEKIKTTIEFDMVINLDSGKSFKSENIKLELPNSNLVEEGTVGKEHNNIESIIFKRLEK